LLVRRPPCWNDTARLARLDTSNVSSHVEPSGIWALHSSISLQIDTHHWQQTAGTRLRRGRYSSTDSGCILKQLISSESECKRPQSDRPTHVNFKMVQNDAQYHLRISASALVITVVVLVHTVLTSLL